MKFRNCIQFVGNVYNDKPVWTHFLENVYISQALYKFLNGASKCEKLMLYHRNSKKKYTPIKFFHVD